jgi:predicted nucleotidyltransferase
MFIIMTLDIKSMGEGERTFDYSMVDKVVDTILRHCQPDLIFLFGSVADGRARYGSDIDVLVVTETDEAPARRGIDILNDLDVDTSVDLIVVTPEEFKEYRKDSRSFTSHILGTGRPLYGTV